MPIVMFRTLAMTVFQKVLRSEVTQKTVSPTRMTPEEEALEASLLGLFRCAICVVLVHALYLESVRCGFEFHLSAVVAGFVLCCVVFFLRA